MSKKKSVQQIINNLETRTEQKRNGVDSKVLKTCLIVQGGGMRASYSMGCLSALEKLGLGDAFDYVLGSSAGAINGAYFIAKQCKAAIEVYSEYLTNNGFINLLRPRKILDASYLIRVLSQGETALDVARVTASKTDLRFSMVHFPSSEQITFSSKNNPKELMNLIKASATVPAISNDKITIDGEKYIDGGIVDPIPIKSAIKLGCTDIVVVLTRSRNFRRRPSRLVYEILSKTYFRDWPKKSKDSLFERFAQVNNLYDFLWSIEGDNAKYRVMIISPKQDNLAGILSRSKKKIQQNAKMGFNDTMEIFKSL